MLKTTRIKELIEAQGRTRKWLALKSGISVGSLHHALGSNRRTLSRPAIMLLAEALGTTVEDISDYNSKAPNKEVAAAAS